MPISSSKPKVLIAVLDWGLGHASRMIPIIDYFISKEYEVALASSGGAFILLKNRFPHLQFYELPAYNMVYKIKSMMWEMARQLPKIFQIRKAENKALNTILSKFTADIIISDNRYGVYNNDIPSIFITHQLQILAPNYLSFINPLLKKLHFKLMTNFNQIWVPDFYGENSLAGKLSNIKIPPNKVKFIGPLSRFNNIGLQNKHSNENAINSILVILSGPEPARTKFENKILPQLEKFEGKSILLRGLPADIDILKTNRVEVFNHLQDKELLPLIQDADIIISRSGYSTIMDMFYLRKKCIFIPTQGQTEQEYLAKRLMSQHKFYKQSESEFNLEIALDNMKSYTGFEEDFSFSFKEMEKALDELKLIK